MSTTESILLMLLAVALSDIVGRFSFVRVPVPILQIAAGILLSGLGLSDSVELSPHLFFFLILAPLLYAEALRQSPKEIYQERKPIIAMAVWLVFVTVFGIGAFVHWLIPEVPFSVACALGAVLAPTDAVAVAAFTSKLPLPQRLTKLLGAESLLNDASGVAALGIAIGVTVTGKFVPSEAVWGFLRLAVGGLFFGTLVGWIAVKIVVWLTHQCDDDPASQVLLALMLPFASFMCAEYFHTSGILAVVATGLTFHALAREQLSKRRRDWGETTWHMLEFSLNGLIFVMLGLQLPSQLGRVPQGLEPSFLHLFGYPVAIVLILMLIRFLWSDVLMRVTLFKSRNRDDGFKHPGIGWVLVSTLAGARGTISLAAALSIPPLLHNGSPFPGREVVLYYATAVVMITLAAAAVGLPILIPRLGKLPTSTGQLQPERDS